MAELPRTHSRYREAHRHGAQGNRLPHGLADLADTDPAIDEAYQSGQAGEPFETFSGRSSDDEGSPEQEENQGTGQEGAPAREAPRRARRRQSSRTPARSPAAQVLTSPRRAARGFVTGSASGAILGAIVYALILSVVDYGTSGPLYWFQAKFLNQVNKAVARKAS
jgi:hypothetical protein